ncbi:MAG: diphthine--ammonia ligase [Balneolaceae bacterium]
MNKPKALFNWSGGKDSSLCLYHVLQAGEIDVSCLFTTVSARYNRISQHGVRAELLRVQAEKTGIPLKILRLPDSPTMEEYNNRLRETLAGFREEGVTVSVFGDIALEDLRRYREEQLSKAGLKGLFPLWKQPTGKLAKEFIDLGFKAVTVCVDGSRLDRSFAGRDFDEDFLKDLPEGIDSCGENGEFHTFVYDGPVFSKSVAFARGDLVYRTYTPPDREVDGSDDYSCSAGRPESSLPGFWFCDLIPPV